MERIRQMSLKKALFTIAFLHIAAAFALSALSFWACVKFNSAVGGQLFVIRNQAGTFSVTEQTGFKERWAVPGILVSALQVFLPVLICTLSLLSAVSLFYRVKLKEPLAVLTQGAMRIVGRDLDFSMEAESGDELGQLITAFETMRRTLHDNHRELWRQAEERRRLNAAFAHNLRNPVTVLKGSVKLAEKSAEGCGEQAEQILRHLALIETYTDRIASYIETMSRIQKLEEIVPAREEADWEAVSAELETAVRFLGVDSGRTVRFEAAGEPGTILIDRSVLFQIAENLVSNGLRFAKREVCVSWQRDGTVARLRVSDDGCGFLPALLEKGIRPFQKGREEAGHFGIGLYTCELLAKKHGGNVTIQNGRTGAVATASIKIK